MTARESARRRRGEPLVALALLLTLWTGARMILWESPFAATALAKNDTAIPNTAELDAAPPSRSLVQKGQGDDPRALGSQPGLVVDHRREVAGSPMIARVLATSAAPPFQLWAEPLIAQKPAAPQVPAEAFVVQSGVAPLPRRDNRWHVDAWAAWRSGSGLSAVASGPRTPSYGGSQIGTAARFDLATGSHRPALHLRATYAPDRPRQADIAAGLGIRPIAGVPVRLMAEARATRAVGRTEVRPALLAVTELPPMILPFALTAEGYAQGGWVGGSYATAFADGQARVTGPVATLGRVRLRAGAGAWGGAQKFAERADVGPTLMLDLTQGRVAARLALDYRVQVAGNATPGDGVALTLSTGF